MTEEQFLQLEGNAIPMRASSPPTEEERVSQRIAFQEHVDRLCSELRPFLLSECLSGNWIAEVWGGWPHQDSLYIMLGKPFHQSHTSLPAGLEFVAVNDPHYWLSEITCELTHHTLACRF